MVHASVQKLSLIERWPRWEGSQMVNSCSGGSLEPNSPVGKCGVVDMRVAGSSVLVEVG